MKRCQKNQRKVNSKNTKFRLKGTNGGQRKAKSWKEVKKVERSKKRKETKNWNKVRDRKDNKGSLKQRKTSKLSKVDEKMSKEVEKGLINSKRSRKK